MSYVDLMANDRWTEKDHVSRTESMVRAQISADEETIINRKFSGALSGQYSLTAQDQMDIARLKAVTEAAQMEGAAARVDAMLLHAALDIEAADAALAAIPPAPVDPEAEDPHTQARAVAQAHFSELVDEASPEVLSLLEQRAAWRAAQNPPEPQPEPEPEPEE